MQDNLHSHRLTKMLNTPQYGPPAQQEEKKEKPLGQQFKELLETDPEFKPYAAGKFQIKQDPDGFRIPVWTNMESGNDFKVPEHAAAYKKNAVYNNYDYTNLILAGKTDFESLMQYGRNDKNGIRKIVNLPDRVGWASLKLAYPDMDIDFKTYAEKKAEIMKTYPTFMSAQGVYDQNPRPGEVYGDIIPGISHRMRTPEQMNWDLNTYQALDGAQKKISEKSPFTNLRYDKEKNMMFEVAPGENTAGQDIIGMFGPPSLYTSGAGGFLRGMQNTLTQLPASAGEADKVFGDLAYLFWDNLDKGLGALAKAQSPFPQAMSDRAGIMKLFDEAPDLNIPSGIPFIGSNPEERQNALFNISKNLAYKSEEDASSLSYNIGNGAAQAIQMYATGLGTGTLLSKMGMAAPQAAKLSRMIAGGSMTLPVGAQFTEQMRAQGIPEDEIRYMSLIMMTITGLSETYLSPDVLVNAYGRKVGMARLAKVMQEPFDEVLKPLMQSGETVPRSAYARYMQKLAQNFVSTARNSQFEVPKGIVKELAKTGFQEGLEENVEGYGQATAEVVHDMLKQYFANDQEYNYADKPKGYFGAPTKGFGDIFNYITKNTVNDFVNASLGAVTGTAMLGFTSKSRYGQMFANKAAEDRSNWSIENQVISGKSDMIRDIATAMKKRGFGYGHLSAEDGSVLTHNSGKKSVDDSIYEGILEHVNEIETLWKTSGVNSPEFIKNVLGNDRPLMVETLDNMVKQQQLIKDIDEIQKQRATDPTQKVPQNAAEDPITQKQAQIKELQSRMDEIKSGKAWNDKLKNGLVKAYFSKPQNVTHGIQVTPGGDYNHVTSEAQDKFNAGLKEKFDSIVAFEEQKREKVAAARKEARELTRGITTNLGQKAKELKKFDIANLKLLDEIEQMMVVVRSSAMVHGMDKSAFDTINGDVKKLLKTLDKESNALMPEVEQNDREAMNTVNRLNDAQGLLSEEMNQLQEASRIKQSSKSKKDRYIPNAEFFTEEPPQVNKDKILNDLYFYDDKLNNIASTLAGLKENAKSMADESIIAKGGFLDQAKTFVNIARQHALVNKDIYSQNIDKRFRNLDPSLPDSDVYYNDVINRASQMLSDIEDARTKIGLNAQDRILTNRARKINTLKFNNDILRTIASSTGKYTDEILNHSLSSKDYIRDFESLTEEARNTSSKLEDAEKATLKGEQLLHAALNEDASLQEKLYGVLEKAYSLKMAAYGTANEVIGVDFNQVYSFKTFENVKHIDPQQRKQFIGFYTANYINTIRRADPHMTYTLLHEALKNAENDGRAPSYEQQQTIKHAFAFMVNPSNDWRKSLAKSYVKVSDEEAERQMKGLLPNSLAVRGYNATGKTSLVLSLLAGMYNIYKGNKGLNIIHVGLNNSLLQAMAAATQKGRTSDAGVKQHIGITLRSLITPENSAVKFSAEDIQKSFANADLIVFDEFSVLDGDEIKKIKDIIEKSGTKSPILFFGDQSQASSENMTDEFLPIERAIERTMPMTVSYRTSSADLNNTVDAIRKVIYFNQGNLDMDTVFTQYNENRTMGVEGFQDKNNLYKQFAEDFRNSRNAILIVKGEDERNRAIEQLAKLGVNTAAADAQVKTIVYSSSFPVEHSAHGLEYPRIYVDLDHAQFRSRSLYYRMLLTAVSRAGGVGAKESYAGIYDSLGKIKSKLGDPSVGSAPAFDKPSYQAKLKSLVDSAGGPVIIPKPETSTETAVPVIMTRKMRAQLKNLGYSKEEIGKLRPEEAHAIINQKTEPEITPEKPVKRELEPIPANAIEKYKLYLNNYVPGTVVTHLPTGIVSTITGLSLNKADNKLFLHVDAFKEPVALADAFGMLRTSPLQEPVQLNLSGDESIDETRFKNTAVKFATLGEMRIDAVGMEDIKDDVFTESARRNIRREVTTALASTLKDALGLQKKHPVELKIKSKVKVIGTSRRYDNVVTVHCTDKSLVLRAAKNFAAAVSEEDIEKYGLDIIGMIYHADAGFAKKSSSPLRAIDSTGNVVANEPSLRAMINTAFEGDIYMNELRAYHNALLDIRVNLANGKKTVAHITGIDGAQVAHNLDTRNASAMTYADFESQYVNGKEQNLNVVSPPSQVEVLDSSGNKIKRFAALVSYLTNGVNPVPVFMDPGYIDESDAKKFFSESKKLLESVKKKEPKEGLQEVVNHPAYKAFAFNSNIFDGKHQAAFPADMIPPGMRALIVRDDSGRVDIDALNPATNTDDGVTKATNLNKFWNFVLGQQDQTVLKWMKNHIPIIKGRPVLVSTPKGDFWKNEFSLSDESKNRLHVLANNIAREAIYISKVQYPVDVKETGNTVSFPSSPAEDIPDIDFRMEHDSLSEFHIQHNNAEMLAVEGKEVLRDIFGSQFVDSRLAFKPRGELVAQDVRKLYGVVRRGGMELEFRLDNNGRKVVHPAAPFHEAVHYAIEYILDPESARTLLDAAKVQASTEEMLPVEAINDKAAHEWLAKTFTNDYYSPLTGALTGKNIKPRRSGLAGIIDDFMRWLGEVWDKLRGNYNPIDSFFSKLDTGYFSNKTPHGGNTQFSPEYTMEKDESFDEVKDEEEDNEMIDETNPDYIRENDIFYFKKVFGSSQSIEKVRTQVRTVLFDKVASSDITSTKVLLPEAIAQVKAKYLERANALLTGEERTQIDNGHITGENWNTVLPVEKHGAYVMYQLARDQVEGKRNNHTLQRMADSIFKKSMSHDTIRDMPSYEYNIHDSQSAYMKAMLSTVPLYEIRENEKGKLEAAKATGYAQPELLEIALIQAGSMANSPVNPQQLEMTVMERLIDNLTRRGMSEYYVDEYGRKILNTTGNSLISFAKKYLFNGDQVASFEENNVINPHAVTMYMLRDEKNDLLTMFPGLKNNINEKSDVANIMLNSLESYAISHVNKEYMALGMERVGKNDVSFRIITRNISTVDEIKNRMMDSIHSKIYDSKTISEDEDDSNIDEAVSDEMRKVFGIGKDFNFPLLKVTREADGISVSSERMRRPMFTLRHDGTVKIDPLADKKDFNSALGAFGVYTKGDLKRDVLNMFWNNTKETIGDTIYNKRRLGEISAAIILSGYNAVNKTQDVTSALKALLRNITGVVLPSGADIDMRKGKNPFYKLINNMAAATVSVQGIDRIRFAKMPDGKRIYKISQGTTTSSSYPLQSRTEDSSIGQKYISDEIIRQNTPDELIRTNPNFLADETGMAFNLNPFATRKQGLSGKIHRLFTLTEISMRNGRTVRFGRGASSRDVMEALIQPYLDSVIRETAKGTILVPGAIRADAPYIDLYEMSFDENDIAGADHINDKFFRKHFINLMNFYNRLKDVSINRWVEFLNANIRTVDQGIIDSYYQNPKGLQNLINQHIDQIGETIFSSDLVKDKDYKVKQDEEGNITSIEIGNDTSFSQNDIFNHNNWKKLAKLHGPDADEEIIQAEIDNMITPAFLEYARMLSKSHHSIPEEAADVLKNRNGDSVFFIENSKASAAEVIASPTSGLKTLTREQVAEMKKKYSDGKSFNDPYQKNEDIRNEDDFYFMENIGIQIEKGSGTSLKLSAEGQWQMVNREGNVMGTFINRGTVKVNKDYAATLDPKYKQKAKYLMHPLYKAHFLSNRIFGHWVDYLNHGSFGQYANEAAYIKYTKQQPGFLPAVNDRGGLPRESRIMLVDDKSLGWKETWKQLASIFGYDDKQSAVVPTDGVEIANPIYEKLLNYALGSDTGVSGFGPDKLGMSYYDMKTDICHVYKNSTLKITEDLFKNSLPAQNMLKAMLSPELFERFTQSVDAYGFTEAVDAMVQYIRQESLTKPEIHQEYVSKIVFTSGKKTGQRRINMVPLSDFINDSVKGESLVYESQDNRYLRYILNSDQEADESKAMAPKQLAAGLGQGVGNTAIADAVNQLNADKIEVIMSNLYSDLKKYNLPINEAFDNYLREEVVQLSVDNIKKLGKFVHLILDKDVDVAVGLLASRVRQMLTNKITREGIRTKVPALRAVAAPGIMMTVFDGADGKVYPLHKVQRMTQEEKDLAGLIEQPRQLNPVRWVNAVTHAPVTSMEEMQSLQKSGELKVLPAEAFVSYPFMKLFDIGRDETPDDVATITFINGDKMNFIDNRNTAQELSDIIYNEISKRAQGITFNDFQEMVDAVVDVNQSPAFRRMMTIDGAATYISEFNKTLDMLQDRIPHGSPGFAAPIRPVGFINDSKSIVFTSAKQNLLDDKDHDIDQVTVYYYDPSVAMNEALKEAGLDHARISETTKRVLDIDNQIHQNIHQWYMKPENQDIIGRKTNVDQYADLVADKIDNLQFNQPHDFSSLIQFYELIFSGKRLIDRMALGTKTYNLLHQVAVKDNSLYESLGFTADGKADDGQYTLVHYGTMLSFAVDNIKHLLFGSLGINESWSPFINGVLLSGKGIEEIVNMSQQDVVREFFDAIDSFNTIRKGSVNIENKAMGYYHDLIALRDKIDEYRAAPDEQKAQSIYFDITKIPILYGRDNKLNLLPKYSGEQKAEDTAEPSLFVEETLTDADGETYKLLRPANAEETPPAATDFAEIDNIVKTYSIFMEYLFKGQYASSLTSTIGFDSKGIRAKDDERERALHSAYNGVEFVMSAPVEQVQQSLRSVESFRNTHPEWWKEKRVMIDRVKHKGKMSPYDLFLEVQRKTRSYGDPAKFINALPHIKAYIKASYDLENLFGKVFPNLSPAVREFESRLLRSQGMDQWSGARQHYAFFEELERFFKDLHMNIYYRNNNFKNPLTPKLSDSYKIVSPGGKEKFWQHFIGWIDELKKQGPEAGDFAKTSLWQNLIINKSGSREFLEIYGIEQMTDEEKVLMQADFNKHFKTVPVPGNPDMTLAEMINIYQQIVTGLALGRHSLIDVTQDDIFQQYSSTLRNVIKPAIFDKDAFVNMPIEVMDRHGKIIPFTMEQMLSNHFFPDVLKRQMVLLPYESEKNANMWRAAENKILKPEFSKRYEKLQTKSGAGKSMLQMHDIKNNGNMVSITDNMTGYDVAGTTLFNDTKEWKKGHLLQVIRSLNVRQHQMLDMGVEVPVSYENEVAYKNGPAVLTDGTEVEITSVRGNVITLRKTPATGEKIILRAPEAFRDMDMNDSKISQIHDIDTTASFKYIDFYSNDKTSGELINAIIENTNNPAHRYLAKILQTFSKKAPSLFNAPVHFKNNGDTSSVDGQVVFNGNIGDRPFQPAQLTLYPTGKKIMYFNTEIRNPVHNYDFENCALHELIHEMMIDTDFPSFGMLMDNNKAGLAYAVETRKNLKKLMGQAMELLTENWNQDQDLMRAVYDYIAYNPNVAEKLGNQIPATASKFIGAVYGLSSISEFTAEMITNPNFQKLMTALPGITFDKSKEKYFKPSIFDNFIRIVTRILMRLTGNMKSNYTESMLESTVKEVMSYGVWRSGAQGIEDNQFDMAPKEKVVLGAESIVPTKQPGVSSDNDIMAVRRILLNSSTVTGAEMSDVARKDNIYKAILNNRKADGSSEYDFYGEVIRIPVGSNLHYHVDMISAKYNELGSKTVNQIVEWVNKGMDTEKVPFRTSFNGKTRYSDFTIEEFNKHFAISNGDIAVRWSDIAGHPTPDGIRNISTASNHLLKGYDPIVIIHNTANRGLPANTPIEVSLFDVTSRSIKNYGAAKFLLDKSLPEFTANERGMRQFSLFLQAMNIMQSVPNIRIRRIGLLQPTFNNINSAYDVMADNEDLLARMKTFVESEKGKKITSKLPESVNKLLQDFNLYDKSFGQEYAWMLSNDYYSDKNNKYLPEGESKSRKALAEKLGNVIAGKGDRFELIKIMRHRQDKIRKKLGEKALEDKEYLWLAQNIRSLTDDTLGAVNMSNTMESIRDLNNISKMVELPQNTGNKIIDWVVATIDRNSRAVVDYTRDIHKQINPYIETVSKISLARNPSLAVSPFIADVSGKIYEKMLKKDVVQDENGKSHEMYTGMIHWNENDADTKALLELGKRDAVNGITMKEVEAGKKFVEIIREQKIYQIMHELSQTGAYGDNMEDDYKNNKSLYDAAVAIYPERWTDGMIPLMNKSASRMFFEGKFKKGVKRWIETANDASAITPEVYEKTYGSMDTEIAAGWLESQDGYYHGVGNPQVRGEMLGMRYNEVSQNWTVIDPSKKEELSTDLEIILTYMALTVQKKIRFENKVLPAVNDAKAILYTYKNQKGGAAMKNSLWFLDKWVNRVVHGQSEQINVQYADLVGNTMLKLSSFGALALNVPVAVTSGIYNTFSMIGHAISNSVPGQHLFSGNDLAWAMKTMSNPENDIKMYKLMDYFGIKDSSQRDVLHSPVHRKGIKKYAFQSHWFHWLNRITDIQARGMVMAAQMHKDGSWDAYSLDQNGEVVYDETKDKQFYQNGVLTETGKILKQHIHQNNINDGWQDKNKSTLDRGYDYNTMRRLKEVGNMVIFGIDPVESPNTDSFLLIRFFTQFKKFIFTKAGQMWSQPYERMATGNYSVDDKGNVAWTPETFEGKLQSVFYAAKNIQELVKQPKEFWMDMTPRQRSNITKMGTDLLMFMIMYMAYSGVMEAGGDDEKKKYKYYGKAVGGNRLMRSWKYAFMDLVNDLSPAYYIQTLKQPFAFVNQVSRAWDLVGATMTGDLSKMKSLSTGVIPGATTATSLMEVAEDFSEQDVNN